MSTKKPFSSLMAPPKSQAGTNPIPNETSAFNEVQASSITAPPPSPSPQSTASPSSVHLAFQRSSISKNKGNVAAVLAMTIAIGWIIVSIIRLMGGPDAPGASGEESEPSGQWLTFSAGIARNANLPIRNQDLTPETELTEAIWDSGKMRFYFDVTNDSAVARMVYGVGFTAPEGGYYSFSKVNCLDPSDVLQDCEFPLSIPSEESIRIYSAPNPEEVLNVLACGYTKSLGIPLFVDDGEGGSTRLIPQRLPPQVECK